MICAIVLAAGRSQRMGTQKLLLSIAGSPMIARVVDAFLGAGVDHLFLIVRPQDRLLRETLGERPIVCVENPDPNGDMLSSVRCGLRSLPPSTEWIAIAPGDQPALTADLISPMLRACQTVAGQILVPVHRGHRGHPVIFSARYRDELLASFDGVGLRGLLMAHPTEVVEYHTENAAVLQDVDTPADYDSARE